MFRKSDEDLFQESTMTFGQHLGDLRRCLFKAISGLLLGTVLGLAIGTPVVNFIQTPLNEALKKHYAKETQAKIKGQLAALETAGYDVAKDSEVREFIARENLSLEEYYVNPRELLHQLQDPAKGGESAAAVRTDADGNGADSHTLKKVYLWRPIANDPRIQTKAFNAQEAFMIYVKASLLVGVVIASPWIFYQIWTFVAAGLYHHERKYVHIFLPFSLGLFLLGVATVFFLVFQPVLEFLFSFNAMLGISTELRITDWMNFVLFMPLAFGVSFQLPLVMLFMERIGIMSVKGYLTYWRVAVLTIFVVAMVFLPTGDAYSLLFLAGSLTILYFGGILLCRFMPRGRIGRELMRR